jgi:hypothetical protein
LGCARIGYVDPVIVTTRIQGADQPLPVSDTVRLQELRDMRERLHEMVEAARRVVAALRDQREATGPA